MAEIVVLDNAAIQELLTSPSGPVFRDIQRRTINVHAGAIRRCNVDTGAMRSDIRWAMIRDEQGIAGLVGTNKEYAGFVHDGTEPHVIEAKAGGALYWKGARHPVKRVNHPGYRGNPFLRDALMEAE